ncbi:MAG: prolyl oligopeptidase family serine peptidase [candidate division KSB1 bacterium]|nr:prolyl oligopeptidase family serine peptidase [candidate division KSB1 bacterium]
MSCLFLSLLMASSLQAQGQRYKDALFPNVNVTKDIVYGQAINIVTGKTEVLKLDLYEPEGDTALERAAVVLVHGGGFTGGDKSRLGPVGTYLAQRGYVAVSINYRLHSSYIDITDTLKLVEATTMAYEDTKAAVRWLRANAQIYRIDTKRIGLFGTSAGAFAVLHAAYEEPEGNSGSSGYSSEVSACAEISGGLIDDTILENGEAPVMIVHGTNDTRVPYEQAIELKNRAQEVGVLYDFHSIQGADHDLTGYTFTILNWTIDFYLTYLIGDVMVPVEFVSFEYEVRGQDVVLKWRTASESNNFGFYVERKTHATDWREIGFVPGQGTTARPQNYDFVDQQLSPGHYAYRLRQVDSNGQIEYSPVLEVDILPAVDYQLLPGYPNPMRMATVFRIFFPRPTSKPAVLHIFNLLGERIWEAIVPGAETGWYEVRWGGRDARGRIVPPGTYFCKLTAGNQIRVQRLQVLR